MRYHAYGYAALITFCLGMVPVAHAELEPISESAMGNVTGQAFMEVENITGTNLTHEYTRMTLGMDLQTRVNIDNVEVGQIDGGSDFSAQHVALGHIARDDGEQFNGVTYNEGETIPFEARKPYIELAEDGAGLAGFRMGFGQARGSVSSSTASFSGNIGMKIKDSGNVYDAMLFDGVGGVPASKRATHIGLAPGSSGQTAGCNVGNGLANCAPLSNLRSLIVGEDTGANDGTVGFTDGFFIGFQRDDNMKWQSLDGANVIDVGQGVFINLPTNMTVDLSKLTGAGIDRLRTHQVDMGNNLF